MKLQRPRYADVAATLALIIALGGTSYAVTALPAIAWAPRNSRPTPSRRPSSQPASPSRAHAAGEGRRGLRARPAPQDLPGTPGVSGYEIVSADSGTTGHGAGALPVRQACPRRRRIHYEGIERLFRSFPLPGGAGWEADGSNS